MKKVLVIAVHPDDETLGCGGTLLKHRANGDQLFWLIATDIKKECNSNLAKIKQHEDELKQVVNKYDFKGIYRLHIPTKAIDTIPMEVLVEKLSAIIKKVKPEVIYLPFQGDAHSDHRYFFQAAYSCTKSFRNHFIKTVLMMETISETEFAPNFKENAFMPNYFVDISKYFDTKLKIMSIYKDELKAHPFPRSRKNIKALAVFRGAMANCAFAESFMLLKEIR